MLRKIKIPFEVFLLLVVVLANIYVVFTPANSLMNWYQTDDAFYYFKVAQNVSEGRGFTFDGFATSSGFHPLWMLVCIPIFYLARFDLILPLRVLACISILLNAGTAVLLYRLLAKTVSREASALIAFFWALYPGIHAVTTMLGMESGISAFFIALLLYQTTRYESDYPPLEDSPNRLSWLGIVAVLAILSRLDNLFLAGMIGIWLVLRRSNNFRYLLLCDLILIAASVFVSYFLRLGFKDVYLQYSQTAFVMLGLALVIKPVIFYAAGLYGHTSQTGWLKQLLRWLIAISLPSIIIAVIMIVLSLLGVFHGFPRTVILYDWGITLVLIFVSRAIFRLVANTPSFFPPASTESSLRRNWKPWLAIALSYGVPIATVLGIYMFTSFLYFGTPTPVSGQIKHWWGTLYTVYGRPVETFWQFFGFPENLKGGAWGLAMAFSNEIGYARLKTIGAEDEILFKNTVMLWNAIFGAIALILVSLNWRKAKRSAHHLGIYPLFASNLAHLFYYNGTYYVNTRHWYWISEMVCIAVFGAILVECAYDLLRRLRLEDLIPKAISTALVCVLLISFLKTLVPLIPPTVPPENKTAYVDGIRALEGVTEPGATIGSTGGGVIAYFIKDRTIVNLDGLMNSYEYFMAMKNRDIQPYLDRIGLDYVYGNAYMVTESEPYVFLLKGRLSELMHVGGATLFRYETNK